MVVTLARTMCAHSPGGFCLNVGGDLGCKNGRGVAPDGANCIASYAQLSLSGSIAMARAAIRAMREPTEAMVEAGFVADPLACDVDDKDAVYRPTFRAMIDAALQEDPNG